MQASEDRYRFDLAAQRSLYLDALTCPGGVVLTTPNAEYNVRLETFPVGTFRHRDHQFEWTRAEFEGWAGVVAERFGYAVRFLPVGSEDPEPNRLNPEHSPTLGQHWRVDM